MAEIFVAIFALLIFIGIVVGAVKTFQRNWLAALLLLIFLFPIWVIWALIEIFTGEIVKESDQPVSATQNVNVTLVSQNEGTTSRIAHESDDGHFKIIDSQLLDERPRELSAVKDETKECPYCAETIRRNAKICRFCNMDV